MAHGRGLVGGCLLNKSRSGSLNNSDKELIGIKHGIRPVINITLMIYRKFVVNKV